MDANVALQRSREVIAAANLNPDDYQSRNFLEYGPFVVDIVQHHWSKQQRANCPWLKEWLETWRKLYDDWETMVRADPGMQYQPQHNVAEAFHKSKAFVRYFRTGNGCSKTQSSFQEHRWFLTGHHPYRDLPQNTARSSFIVGLDFNKYMNKVFGPKMLWGEPNNYLSPMFPERGKWFYWWDKKAHTLYLGCPDCAKKGKAQSCPGHHQKSALTLYSDERGWEALSGFAGSLGHFDEHISDVKTYQEAMQRLLRVAGSNFMITATPLHGEETWETVLLANKAEGPRSENKLYPNQADSPPMVELFQIDQYSAGIVPKWKIDMARQTMDDFEVDARIYGNPAPIAEIVVFDRAKLSAMRQAATEPKRGNLYLDDTLMEMGNDEGLLHATYSTEVRFNPTEDGPVRVWEEPAAGASYIMAVDSAAGLSAGNKKYRPDYSCTTVLRWIPDETKNGVPRLRMVAQWHGYIDLNTYADEIKKLGVWYNYALCAIELTGGMGTAVMERLRRKLGYWNLFRGMRKPEEIESQPEYRFGVDTNQNTKPTMVANLQTLVHMGQLDIPCKSTIAEMVSFAQERTEKGIITRFRGAGGAKDDRVMSLAIAAYVTLSFPIEAFFQGVDVPVAVRPKDEDPRWATIRKEIEDKSNPYRYY